VPEKTWSHAACTTRADAPASSWQRTVQRSRRAGGPPHEALEQTRATPTDSDLSRLANPVLVFPLHDQPLQPVVVTSICIENEQDTADATPQPVATPS